MRNIRLISFSRFQVSSLVDVSFFPLQGVSASLLSLRECISSSFVHSPTPIDVYRHLYKVVGTHLQMSIGDWDVDRNTRINKGVERSGNTE